MDPSTRYAGFGDAGNKIKGMALNSAIATLVIPLSWIGIFIIASFIVSAARPYFGSDYVAYNAYSSNAFILSSCILGGVIALFFLAITMSKVKMVKTMMIAGEQSVHAGISSLAKHYRVELVLSAIIAPLFAVTAILFLASGVDPYSPASRPPGRAILLLVNCVVMMVAGMYSVIDGFKKWEPFGQVLTSYKGRTGISYLKASFSVGLAIFIMAHFFMTYFLMASIYGHACPGSIYPYPPACSVLSIMVYIFFPVAIACGIMTLIGVINHIKGLFRVGNTFIDLEAGTMVPSSYSSGYYRPVHAASYNAQPAHLAPASNPPVTGDGYQHGTWNAPRYTASLQPVQLVQPIEPATPAPTVQPSTTNQVWSIDSLASSLIAPIGVTRRCKRCQATLPESEDVAFCPYCGAPV